MSNNDENKNPNISLDSILKTVTLNLSTEVPAYYSH